MSPEKQYLNSATLIGPSLGRCDMIAQVNTVTGMLGEREAERRDQAHQPFEPDLEKLRVVLKVHQAEDERRECDR